MELLILLYKFLGIIGLIFIVLAVYHLIKGFKKKNFKNAGDYLINFVIIVIVRLIIGYFI